MDLALPCLIDRFAPLAARYDAVLSDIWGVVHNGVTAFPEACDALVRFRGGGGVVVLVSNAPRPFEWVRRHLGQLGVPPAAYDGIVTSGDVAHRHIAATPGAKLYHLGPERDLANFADVEVTLVAPEDADYVVCTGLFHDETETPDDYRDLLNRLRRRGLRMICANPDLVVERGHRLIYCAGALAEAYAELGGEVVYTGKPHRPIYDEALARIEALRGKGGGPARVLAIGDSVRTDVRGAIAIGVDCLFVMGGIHAEEIGGRAEPDLAALDLIFAEAGVRPKAVTQRLAW